MPKKRDVFGLSIDHDEEQSSSCSSQMRRNFYKFKAPFAFDFTTAIASETIHVIDDGQTPTFAENASNSSKTTTIDKKDKETAPMVSPVDGSSSWSHSRFDTMFSFSRSKDSNKTINSCISKMVDSKNLKTPASRVRKTNVAVSGLGHQPPPSSSKYNVHTTSRLGQTPGSRATSNGSGPKSFVVVAIVEGRGVAKGELGMASMDVRHPELALSQFADTAGYSRLLTKLHILDPVEIVVPETAVEKGGDMAVLLELLKTNLPNAQVTAVPRRYFNDAGGLELLTRLKVAECSTIEKDIAEKYYCLSSVAALIKYIEYIQNIAFACGSVKITYKGVENTCMIDPVTIKDLELIVSLKNGSKSSLYSEMNRTYTACGARMLRSSLLQPPANVDVIEQRLDAVEELLSNEPLFRSLRSLMSRMLDVEQLITLCVHLNREETVRIVEYKITQIIHLKHTLELVEPLRDALASRASELFVQYSEWLSDCRLKEIVERLHETIDENVSHQKGALNMRSQRCFAIKSGINSSLDFVRRTYTELIEDVSEAAAEETATCPYPMRTVYSVGRGFHLTTTVRDGAGGVVLPDCFINVVRQRNTITCTTRTLIRLNDRLNQAVASVMQLSNEVVTALLADLRQYIACLYNLTEVLANVDMLTSIAHFCSLAQSVRPEFSSSLAIRAGRHPLLERTALCEMTPNDTYASAESCFVIITGPNMAGKSTYLKQVALLQIMAQAGCMVPADYACFRVCDHIFSRIDYNDDLENNSSAFMVEMKDMSYILQHLTDKSLVVIDELGRSTSTEEGIGLSFAICEELILSSALVFFATHFLDLAILDANYSCVENYHFGPQVVRTHEEDGDVVEKLEPNHKLAKGPYRGPLYGFELAEVSTLPRSVLNCAKELALKLREQSAILRSNDEEQRRQRAEFRLGQRLLRAAKFAKNADEEKMRLYLKNLKLQYHADIAAVNIC